jgi:hypothetical protein
MDCLTERPVEPIDTRVAGAACGGNQRAPEQETLAGLVGRWVDVVDDGQAEGLPSHLDRSDGGDIADPQGGAPRPRTQAVEVEVDSGWLRHAYKYAGPCLARAAAMLLRLVLTVLLALLPSVASAQETSEDEAPFVSVAGDWSRHGFLMRVLQDGTAHASWRVYQWCGPGVPEPCDRVQGNFLISGGQADVVFASGGDGEVAWSTDPAMLDVGPLTLTPIEYGMAVLQQGEHVMVLCGPRYLDEAPPEIIEASPCGA